MQVPLPASLTRLNLTDPEVLFKTPDGVDEAVIRQAFDSAMAEAEALDREPSPQDRLRIIAEAGRRLLADPAHLTAAVYWTQAAAPEFTDGAPLAHIRLLALWRQGDRSATIAEADRLLSAAAAGSPVRKLVHDTLRRWNAERELPARAAYLEDYWGDLDAALQDPVGAIKADSGFPQIDRLASPLADLNNVPEAEREEFTRRLCWGMQWHRCLRQLRLAAAEVTTSIPAAQHTARHRTILALNAKVHSLFIPPDLESVTQGIASGRSAVLSHPHAGLTILSDLGLRQLSAPLSLVTTKGAPLGRPNDFHVSTISPTIATDFAKLTKLMRKQPRIVRIFPDGPHGQTVEAPLLGRQVRIGRGAAVLAYLGRAATFFSTSHWDGHAFRFDLVPGPDPRDFDSIETFDATFTRFFLDRLQDILLGPPEDMAPDGGIWPFFR
ncbi:MAG: hypothetical protein AB7S99_00015 [Pseudodonghicola sp.]